MHSRPSNHENSSTLEVDCGKSIPLTLAWPRGVQLDPPSDFLSALFYACYNHHCYQWLFQKYCFVNFFEKKIIVGRPPAVMGGHFQIALWPKFAILKLLYNKNSQNWDHFLWPNLWLRPCNFIIINHFLQNSPPIRSFWTPKIAKNLKIWQF